MGQVLMPKATAVWLIENTAVTFDQVADFCGLHPLEVQSIADGEVAIGMAGFDPIYESNRILVPECGGNTLRLDERPAIMQR